MSQGCYLVYMYDGFVVKNFGFCHPIQASAIYRGYRGGSPTAVQA